MSSKQQTKASSSSWSRKTPPIDGKAILLSNKLGFASSMNSSTSDNNKVAEKLPTNTESFGLKGVPKSFTKRINDWKRENVPPLSASTSSSKKKQDEEEEVSPKNPQKAKHQPTKRKTSSSSPPPPPVVANSNLKPNVNNLVVFENSSNNNSSQINQNLISTEVAKGTFRKVANTNGLNIVPTRYQNNNKDASNEDSSKTKQRSQQHYSMSDQLQQIRPSQIKRFVDGWIDNATTNENGFIVSPSAADTLTASGQKPLTKNTATTIEYVNRFNNSNNHSMMNVNDISSVSSINNVNNSNNQNNQLTSLDVSSCFYNEEENDHDHHHGSSTPAIMSGTGKNFQVFAQQEEDDDEKGDENNVGSSSKKKKRSLSSLLVSQVRITKEAEEVEQILLERRRKLILGGK